MGQQYELVIKEIELVVVKVMRETPSTPLEITLVDEPQDNIEMGTKVNDAPMDTQDDTIIIWGERITIDTSEDPFASTIEDPFAVQQDYEAVNLVKSNIVDYLIFDKEENKVSFRHLLRQHIHQKKALQGHLLKKFS